MNIGEIISDFATWLVDLLLWLPRKIFSEIMTAVGAFFVALPVPDFITKSDIAMASIPSGVVYAIGFFKVPEGIAMVVSAYIIRFIIRRIPFFG